MDYSVREILLRAQDDEVPFIGDLMSNDFSEVYDIKKKTIEVTSLTFNGQKFHGEVVLSGDFSEAPVGYDYVIVGIKLTVKPDKKTDKQEISAVWTVPGFTKVRSVDLGFALTPTTVLTTVLLMSLDDFSQLEMMPGSLVQTYHVFQMIENVMKHAGDIRNRLSNIIVEEDRKSVDDFINFFFTFAKLIRYRVETMTSSLNSGNWVKNTLYVIDKSMWAENRVQMGENFLMNLSSTYEKQKEIQQFCMSNQLEYIRDFQTFQRFCEASPEFYVLYFCNKDWPSNREVVGKFLKMKSELGNKDFCIADLDFMKTKGEGVKPFVIQNFKNGTCQVTNVLQDVRRGRMNVAKYIGKEKRLSITPKSRALLVIPCPGFYTAQCPNVRVKWLCHECHMQLYYGFDDNLYCSCGAGNIGQFTFRCDRDAHDQDFLPLTKVEVLSTLEPMKMINIIVLGQSGVGKSTWINAFVNYMTFNSLQDARSSEFLVPIPVKFTVTDDKTFKQLDVICGNHEVNENLNIGESATQNCKDYNIVFEDKIYNIIDTPGLGDTRGIEEDKKNVKKILDHLRQVDVIHGICLILKPNEARITVLLKYCLKEILSNLHKSSSNNLLFCFTHARSTFYRAGETLPTLQRLLKEIDIDTSCLSRSFHMDNEAFRFLCCQSADIKFSKDEEITFSESWDRSVVETKKLLETVGMMAPHLTSDTLSLNRSRNIILTLIPFMVEISENIERNLREMKNHKKTIENHKGTLEELKVLRFTTQIDIKRERLSHPRTVCASERCVEYVTMPKTKERQVIYKTHCHPHCYLSGQLPDAYPNPELTGCAAMNGTSHCVQCYCSWTMHMHIFYEQHLEEKLVKDLEIERTITNYNDKQALKADLIAADQRRIKGLQREKDTVISHCVKFACFLKENAIVAFNDSFLDYLEITLRNLRNIPNKTQIDTERIEKMEEMKKIYVQEKKIFSDAIKRHNPITADDIARCEKELYDLPVHGRELRDIMSEMLKNQMQGPRDRSQATTIVAQRKGPGMIKKAYNYFFGGPQLEPPNRSEPYSNKRGRAKKGRGGGGGGGGNRPNWGNRGNRGRN